MTFRCWLLVFLVAAHSSTRENAIGEESTATDLNTIYDIALSNDNEFMGVITGGPYGGTNTPESGTVWRISEPGQKQKIENVAAVAFDDKPTRLLSCSADGQLQRRAVGTWQRQWSLNLPMKRIPDDSLFEEGSDKPRITVSEFSDNGSYFVYVIDHYLLNVWNVDTRRLVFSTRNMKLKYKAFRYVRVFSVSPLIVACVGDRDTDGEPVSGDIDLLVVEPDKEEQITRIESGRRRSFEYLGMTVAARKPRIAAFFLMDAGHNGFALHASSWRLLNPVRQEFVRRFDEDDVDDLAVRSGPFRKVSLSDDTKIVAAAIPGKKVTVLNSASGEILHEFHVPRGESSCVRFRPANDDQQQLFSGTTEGRVYSWNLETERMTVVR